MTITKIREVPSKLPPACLYLDDIREITDILVEAYTPVAARHGEEVAVLYRFGRDKSDTQATSIDDLRNIGGSAKYFHIEVGGLLSCDVRIYDTLPPEVSLYALSENEQRVTFQKIDAVFQHRVLAVRNVLLQLPSWVGYFAWAINVILPVLIFSSRASLAAKIAFGLIYIGLLLGAVVYYFQPSRVIFAHSYEKSRQKTETRKSYVRDLVFALLGAGLALLVQVIIKKWF